jgi:Ser/Thr protein kinase RdoA (MazF antagonist)
MTLGEIKQFCSIYDVPLPVSFKELPRTTSGNTSYVINTDDKKYVLRLLIRQGIDSVKDEHNIQRLLNNSGITTPIYIRSLKGNLAEQIGDNVAVISELIPGARQTEDTIELAYNMSATLAVIHNILSTTQVSFNEQQWFHPRNVSSQLQTYNGPDKSFITETMDRYKVILRANLPLALTHGDFHTNNIFSLNDEVTAVFDFESAEYTVRILDIARLYLTYIKVTNLEPQEVCKSLIEGYDSAAERHLTKDELAELPKAFVYVALVSSVSIYNHGNDFSSSKYLAIAKDIIKSLE